MTRITNADHVLILLRNHLERTDKGRSKRRKGAETRPVQSSPLERVERLAASDGLSELEIRRALISGLLAEEFGEDVINDPHFQQIVDDVVAILQRDPKAEALLQAACKHLVQR